MAFFSSAKSLKVAAVVGLLSLFVFLGFQQNWFNLQDKFYGSRYFRPYAELKQEPLRDQVVLLQDNKILLVGRKQSEIFDPKSKSSEMVPGLESIRGSWDYSSMLVLADGNVLFMAAGVNGITETSGEISCWSGACPINQVPIFDVKLKKFRWIPSAFLRNVTGHTSTLLPNGKVLIVGGIVGWNKDRSAQEAAPEKPYSKNDIVVFDPETFQTTVIGHLQIHRYNHKTLFVDPHHVLVFGGTYYNDDPVEHMLNHREMTTNTIELVNLNTGDSKIVGQLKSFSYYQPEVFPVSQKLFLIAQDNMHNGVVTSEIFDLSAPGKIELIKGEEPSNYWDGTGVCTPIPNHRFICLGTKGVRDIVPRQKKNRNIDRHSSPVLSNVVPIYVPEVGLLVFGTSNDIMLKERTVQYFNEARYRKDFK